MTSDIDTFLSSVLTPDAAHPEDPNRRADGKFARGNAGGPGRPPRKVEEEILQAVNEVSTPERVKAALEQMFALAEEYKSWKAYQAALTLSLAYQLGRPTTRIQTTGNNTLAELLAQLPPDDEE